MKIILIKIPNASAELRWFCPGCKMHHQIPCEIPGSWDWNSDLENPNVYPSIFVNRGQSCPSEPACHSLIFKGTIQFMTDCTHALAGKTVPMESLDD